MIRLNDSLDEIEIRGNNPEETKGLLMLLPKNTFPFIAEFRRGLSECGEKYCGQIGIYAKKEPLLGEKGVMLVIINEHLFGDATTSDYNPVLRIPNDATNICLVPPRQSPLKKNHPFAGVEFQYQRATFFFGYELSERAYSAIVQSLNEKDIV